MKSVQIFTEGNTDKRFLEAFILHIGKSSNNVRIKSINGWQGIKTEDVLVNLESSQRKGIKNILILDADTAKNGGGFQNRKEEIDSFIKSSKPELEYDLFLFPNNKDDGDLETLLEKITNPKHQNLLECFEEYEKCIEAKNKDLQYQTPNQKAKMYAYISSFNLSSEKRDNLSTDWLFENTEYWNLKEEYLCPLKNFLQNLLP